MALREWLSGQFIDIIEWTEPSQNEILAYRFQRHNNEIKNGAKLIVREGQAAVFVKEGQLADVKTPGMYTLDTNNMPILSTILGWKYGFESPFKCEVYFVSTRQWTDQKWGTQNPVMMRDPEFGPVRVRAFGTYAFKITDPGTFVKEIVSTDPMFEAFEIAGQFRNVIVSRFVDTVGQAKIPVLDLVGNYEKMSELAKARISPELAKMGVSLVQYFVENISLPPEVEAALDKRSQMGVLGNLDQYMKFQTAEAVRDAASNPGGTAGAGMGLGAGVAFGQQMGAAMAAGAAAPAVVAPSAPQAAPPAAPQAALPAAPVAPPPLPTAVSYHVALKNNTEQAGPFNMTVLSEKIRAGEITKQSLVWKSGMAGWVPADQVADFQQLFATLPPPLPKG